MNPMTLKTTNPLLCVDCARGPQGIGGHAQLMVHSLGALQMSFKCGSCRALWSRAGKRQGEYGWTDLGGGATQSECVGVLIPRRLVAMESRAHQMTP